MLIGDLVYNDNFDLNCNYAVYEGQWNNGGKLLWSTAKNGYKKPPNSLLDRKVGYITLDTTNLVFVIEAKSDDEEDC